MELSKNVFPFLGAYSHALSQVFEDVCHGCLMVRREFQSLAHSVKDPAKDEFLSAPPTISLEELL